MESKGFDIKAIDLDAAMIHQARVKYKNSSVDLQVMNMLSIAQTFCGNSFDGIFCYRNTLVHLTKHGEIEKFFDGIHSLLKPNSQFLFQI
ncbi:MAG: class I SAM-dependent methyltransferase [Prolixibacteraceae bacterium]